MFGVLNTKILIKAALVAAAPMAGALGLASLPPSRQEPGPTVFVDAGSFLYREAGDYARGGRPVNAPLTRRRVAAGLHVMKRQVSAAEYEACVADDACAPRAAREDSRADLPVTGVNWQLPFTLTVMASLTSIYLPVIAPFPLTGRCKTRWTTSM